MFQRETRNRSAAGRMSARAVRWGLLAAMMGMSYGEVGAGEAWKDKLEKHLAQDRFRHAQWGVKICAVDDGSVLFDYNGHKLLKPASNAKLYTGALALDRLGPDYRIRTSFYGEQPLTRWGTLKGPLIVYGRGDPSLAARFHDGDYEEALDRLGAAFTNSGLRRIRGGLIGDESFFRGPPFGHGWAWDDLQYYYGAQVSALTVQDNVVDLRIEPGPGVGERCRLKLMPETGYLVFSNLTRTVEAGAHSWVEVQRPVGQNTVFIHGEVAEDHSSISEAVTVHAPALWFLHLLREELKERGIRVSGGLRSLDWRDRWDEPLDTNDWVELAGIDSPPMIELVKRMMKPSQNLYAQLLLLQVGKRAELASGRMVTSEQRGLAEMRRFMEEAGIGQNEVLLEEGSGLSRGALVTPAATVRLLLHMSRHRHAEAFREALPVAGVDGTLRRRFRGTPAEGRVRAKTGTLRFVNTLSGYAPGPDGRELAFSLMLNNYNYAGAGPTAREDLDAVVLMMMMMGSGGE